MPKSQKCAHPACNCTVRDGEKYCSPYCHDAEDKVELSCNCRHAACGDQMTPSG